MDGTIQLQDGGDTGVPTSNENANIVPDDMPTSIRVAHLTTHSRAHGDVERAANSHQSSQTAGVHRMDEPVQSFDISIDEDKPGLHPAAGMGLHSEAGQARHGQLAPEFLNIGHGQVLGGAQEERNYVTDPDWREGTGFEEPDMLTGLSSNDDSPGGARLGGAIPASDSDVHGAGVRSSPTVSAHRL